MVSLYYIPIQFLNHQRNACSCCRSAPTYRRSSLSTQCAGSELVNMEGNPPRRDESDSDQESVKNLSMAIIPWTYNNPRVDRRHQKSQQFLIHGHSIEIVQDTTAEINVNQNTGLKLWDGAYLLARYLENETDFPGGFWKGKRCVELGAGCGLVGMAAWLLGAEVILTDIDDMLAHTNKCVKINQENLENHCDAGKITCASLWWGSSVKHLNPPCDVILGSDVIYQKECITPLLQSLQDLSNKDTVIYITYKPRGLGEDSFFENIKDYSFQCTTLSSEKHPIEFKGTDYRVLKIVKVQ